MTARRYATPAAFKHALEERLRGVSEKHHTPMHRVRQRLVFDRFLARIFAEFGSAALLKGGAVLELRLARARTTKDVDLRLTGSPEGLLERLQAAGRRDAGDHLLFEIGPGPQGDVMDGEGLVYEGRRFRAEARLAGKVYGDPFGVDVAFGDVLTGTPELIDGSDLLDFAGVPRARLRLYPREAHVAEKLHAYTLPRARENSWVKDLPDLALLAQTGAFHRAALRAALERTFTFRGTHALPRALPPPPASWDAPYARMARDNGLPWVTLAEVFQAASAFLEPVLTEGGADWSPELWAWR
jgi:hypothetical protein